MIWLIGMQILAQGYCLMYFRHSVKQKRVSQAAAIAVLTLLMRVALALLIWEYLTLPT